jgi:asparagine synthase (glutamine-hydrolysing)
MPGIAGIIRRSSYERIGHDLTLMVDAMRHEEHYSAGKYVDESLGLYVGWTAQRGSFADCMPVVSPNKDVVLIFQGENFFDSATRTRLRRSGLETEGTTAASLLQAYLTLDEAFFNALNGWYSGVIADLRTKQIILFNDRYGMGRVYLHENQDEFIFASEAKAILSVRPARRRIAPQALAEYLRFNCVLGDKTLFSDISLLPNGSRWNFEAGALQQRSRYFSFADWENQIVLPQEEFYPKLAETISRVFPMYAAGMEKVALSLTAGLDTRTLLAGLPGDHVLPCYTFGGPWSELLDIRIARKIAQISSQPFTAITADETFLKNFPKFAQRTVHISDGTHDAFSAHDVYFNAIARQIAPVRLTGKFGSEVVRIRRLIPSMSYPGDLLRPELRQVVDRLPRFAELGARHPLTRVVAEEIPWHEFGRVSIEQSQITLRTPYMDNELVKLMYQAPPEVRGEGLVQERYVRERSPALSAVPTNMGIFATERRLLTKLLYVGLRGLLKLEYIYLFTTPHWMTRIDRRFAWLRLERILSGRQKWEGYRIWINTDFAAFIRETLLRPGAHHSQFFQREAVERMVTRHVEGTHNYLNEINRVLTFELICTSLLVPQASGHLSC